MADINRKVKFTSDVTAAVNGIKQVEKAVTSVNAEVKATSKTQAAFVAELEKTKRSTAIEDLARDYAKLANETKDADRAARDLLKRLDEIGASESEIAGAARAFNRFQSSKVSGDDVAEGSGNIGSISSSAAGVLGSLGGGAAQDALALLGNIGDVTEKLPRVAKGITDIGTAASGSSGVVGTIASGIGTALPGIGAAGAGVAALGTVAAVAAPLVIAGALALDEYNKSVERGRVLAELTSASIQNEAERRFQINELIKAGDRATLEAQRDAAIEQVAITQESINRITALRDEAQSKYNNSSNPFERGELGASIDKYNEDLKVLQSTFILSSQSLYDYSTALNDTSLSAVESARESAASLEAVKQKQDEYRQTIDASLQSIQSYTDQIDALNESFTTKNTRESITNTLQGIFDATEAAYSAQEKAEDAADAREGREDAHQARLAQIETQGNQTIEGLREASTQKATDTQKSIDQLQAQAYVDDEKALKAYNQRIAKIEADARRKQEEALGAMSDARLNFDVLAFKKATEAFDKAEREEFKGKRRATREFNDDKAERDRVLAEKIKALNDELIAFQVAQQAKIDAELVAINNRLLAEQAAFDASEKKLEEREARNEQRANDRAQRRADFDERLDNLREGWELDDHNTRLSQLSQQRDAAQSNHDAALKNLTQTTGAIEKAKEATDALTESVTVLSEKTNWWDMLPKPGVDFPVADSTINNPGDYNTAPTADEIGGGGIPDMMNPNAIGSSSRRPSFANTSAFASGKRGGANQRGNVNITNQISILVGEHVTKKDLTRIEKTIKKTQSETIAGIELAFFEGQKVMR
jgi:hypothetical protein